MTIVGAPAIHVLAIDGGCEVRGARFLTGHSFWGNTNVG